MFEGIRNWMDDTSFCLKPVDMLYTGLIMALATLLAALLNNQFIERIHVAVIYILAVAVVSCFTTGYLPGVLASILGVVGVNYIFTYPYLAFDFTRTGYPLTFATMLIVSIMISTLTTKSKEQARLSAIRESRTNAVYEITKNLVTAGGFEDIMSLATEYISKLYGCGVVFYLGDPSQPTQIQMEGTKKQKEKLQAIEEVPAAARAYLNQEITGSHTKVSSDVMGYYIPVTFADRALGVIGLCGDVRQWEDPEGKILLNMVITQIEMAMEHQRLTKQQQEILVEAEKEKMRSNLLRAISHDLRTPLTSIQGSSSVILESGGMLDEETLRELISDIKTDSQWLIRMVENLLSVTRISAGDTAKVNKKPEAVEEIVAEAVGRIKARYPQQKINVKVPEEFLMIPMDGTLIEQVIINLIENAILHGKSPLPIEMTVKQEKQDVVFSVRDYGEGIASQELPYLFEGYSLKDNTRSDGKRGMGIGLSICRSIVKAHGGEIEVITSPGQGCTFYFTLPKEDTVHEQ